MKLTYPGGNLTIELDGFAYGAPRAGCPYDELDWIMVRVCMAEHEHERTFDRRDPCLTVGDAICLVDWLYAVAADVEITSRLHFMEPNLAFESRDGVLIVTLAAECTPSSISDGGRNTKLRLNAVREEIWAAARDFERNLIRILPGGDRDGVSSPRITKPHPRGRRPEDATTPSPPNESRPRWMPSGQLTWSGVPRRRLRQGKWPVSLDD